MAGIEVAGLVLGALPLIIEAIKIYADGASTVERYLRFEEPLRNLYVTLETEYAKYQNTCEQLLTGILDNNTRMAILLEDPGGPAWKDEELESMVKQRLSRSYSGYQNTMKKLNLAIDEIKKLLKLGPEGEVQINCDKGFKKEYKRLKFSMRKSHYDKLVTTIRENNADLAMLTHQNLSLESSRASRQSKRSPNFSIIQKCARSVYESIQSCLRCGCSTPHDANLRLDTTATIENGPFWFDIVFSYTRKEEAATSAPWKLEAVEVGPIADTSQNTETVPLLPNSRNAKNKRVRFQEPEKKVAAIITPRTCNLTRISDLCGAICQLQRPQQEKCIGFLVDDSTNQKHGIFRPSPAGHQKPNSLMSLRQVLSQSDVALRIGGFTMANKVRLAASVTMGFLRLYGTPWLRGTWKKEEIVFLNDTTGTRYERSYVVQSFQSSLSTQGGIPLHNTALPQAQLGQLNQVQEMSRVDRIVDLGILLIEICLGKPLDILIGGMNQHGNPDGPKSEWKCINKLVDIVSDEACPGYSEAVRRCVYCDFGKKVTEMSDEEFFQMFYHQVVSPLEEDLVGFVTSKKCIYC